MGKQTTGPKLVGSILAPILVLADDGPLLFANVEDAERYLEPIDVRNGEYRAFDADGHELALSIETEVRGRLFRSELEVTRIRLEESTAKADELRTLILAWVSQHYPDRSDEMSASTLAQMVTKLVEWLGYQK